MVNCELVTTITAIACIIAQNYSDDDLELIAAIFTQLGDTLSTITTQQGLCNKDVEN